MQDPALAEPERDVVSLPLGAKADEVAGLRLAFLEASRGGLLLVCVAGDELREPAVGHVDESGAVDPPLGQAAPLVRHAEVRARFLERVACPRQARPLTVGLATERLGADPAGV